MDCALLFVEYTVILLKLKLRKIQSQEKESSRDFVNIHASIRVLLSQEYSTDKRGRELEYSKNTLRKPNRPSMLLYPHLQFILEICTYRGGFFNVKWHVYMYEYAHLLWKLGIFIQINMPFYTKMACLYV